jgi:hypothetical protein
MASVLSFFGAIVSIGSMTTPRCMVSCGMLVFFLLVGSGCGG